MNPFDVSATALAGLMHVTRRRRQDTRGFFGRFFCVESLLAAGWRYPVAQINHSLTRERGTVRGMHFQHPPHAEAKFVSCLRGAVFDVAVDLREGSPTFLAFHGATLSASNGCSLLIPPGFAHGFQALEPDSEMIYVHSHPYVPDAEAGLRVDDPRLRIEWPLPVRGLSERDGHFPWLSADYRGLQACS